MVNRLPGCNQFGLFLADVGAVFLDEFFIIGHLFFIKMEAFDDDFSRAIWAGRRHFSRQKKRGHADVQQNQRGDGERQKTGFIHRKVGWRFEVSG